MAAEYFPDTTELQMKRLEYSKQANEAKKNENRRRPKLQPKQESNAAAIMRERELIISEFYRKMQALGEPYDEAWSHSPYKSAGKSNLNTKAYVINYFMSDAPGSAVLSAWVSGERLFAYIFNDVIPDVPFYTRSLDYSIRNLSLIDEEEWKGILGGMKGRLQGRENICTLGRG